MSVIWKGNQVYLDNKRIGWIAGTTYKSPRIRSMHYFRNFEGYGISTVLLHQLKDRGVEKITLFIWDGQRRYNWTATLTDFLYSSSPYKHQDFDEQLILHEDYFQRT